MKFISHKLLNPETIEEREYQLSIFNTASKGNTLVVLPTGTGKTNIAILLAINRLEKYPDSKILVMAPSRPLNAQHQKSFKRCLNIPEEEIVLVTGKINPYNRSKLYKQGTIIIGTPQTFRNDIENEIFDLENFSLLVTDEAHKCVKNYAYTSVAKTFLKQSKHPLILGLTASPGSSKERINEICNNLSIDHVEIRTEDDKDVSPYIKEKEIEWIKVELPDKILKIQQELKKKLSEKQTELKKYGINAIRKADLIDAQKKVSKRISQNKNPINYYIVSVITQTIKIWYLLELIETQSIESARKYIKKIMQYKTKSDKVLASNLIKIFNEINSLNVEHPKIEKIKNVIENELKQNNKIKFIVFSHYRNNIEKLYDVLKQISGCRPAILIGQAGEKGLSQKQQIEIIRQYEDNIFNCLITSPIGEEGIDIHGGADVAIFYEPVSSEIRTIQRRGRVGRTKVGKIIILLTQKTRDEVYFYISKRKESKMKNILKDMQNNRNLDDFI
ncbi:MAG: DEAD/DEAH box helicase [Candidatus Aenigmarchaeota archaeon]|nr:DEAD/DEAH box helicase [Candidatus Aenigmarchaeota archaeon]